MIQVASGNRRSVRLSAHVYIDSAERRSGYLYGHVLCICGELGMIHAMFLDGQREAT